MMNSRKNDRFAKFTGWELQCLARGVSWQGAEAKRAEQAEAQERLMDEIHAEFDIREDLDFSDPEATR